jgi:hypothetical protein
MAVIEEMKRQAAYGENNQQWRHVENRNAGLHRVGVIRIARRGASLSRHGARRVASRGIAATPSLAASRAQTSIAGIAHQSA